MRWLLAALLSLCAAAHAALTPLPGTTPQSAPLGQPFANPIKARLTDAAGNPVSGSQVYYTNPLSSFNFSFGRHNCPPDSFNWCSVVTDAEGVATVPAFGPFTAGAHTFRLSTLRGESPGDALFELTGVPTAPAAKLEFLQGGRQISLRGTFSVAVRLTREGVPVAGQTISFSSRGPSLYTVAYGCCVTDAEGVTGVSVESLYGIGDGELVAGTFDTAAGVNVFATTPYRVTTAEGLTVFPLRKLWWAGETQAGWGLYLGQSGETVVPVIFAYDRDGQPTWLTFSRLDWSAGFATYIQSPLERTKGTPYFAYDASTFTATSLGFAQVDYKDEATLRLSFSTGSLGIAAAQAMNPLQVSPYGTRSQRDVADLWWGGPAQAGWGIAIEEQADSLFLAWFTYDASGAPVWYLMDEGRWVDAVTWTGRIYKTSGAPVTSARPYDASLFRRTDVGTFTIAFDGNRRATFDYLLEGHSGRLQLERFSY